MTQHLEQRLQLLLAELRQAAAVGPAVARGVVPGAAAAVSTAVSAVGDFCQNIGGAACCGGRSRGPGPGGGRCGGGAAVGACSGRPGAQRDGRRLRALPARSAKAHICAAEADMRLAAKSSKLTAAPWAWQNMSGYDSHAIMQAMEHTAMCGACRTESDPWP